jgi:hypothetical protein
MELNCGPNDNNLRTEGVTGLGGVANSNGCTIDTLTVGWTISRGNLLISKKVQLTVRKLAHSYGSMLPYQGIFTKILKDNLNFANWKPRFLFTISVEI